MKDTSQTRFNFISLFFAFAFGAALATLINQKQQNSKPTDTDLIDYRGVGQTIQDLPANIAMPLYELELEHYQKKFQMLEEAGLQLHIEKLAAEKGQSLKQAGDELLKAKTPSEEEIADFYNNNKSQFKKSFYELKSDIKQYLTRVKQDEKRRSVIDKLTKEGNLAILLKKPNSPVVSIYTKGYPSIGPENAPAQIVEFADYQCPHCKVAGETLHALREKYGKDIRITYMDFPINRSGISRKIAEGAACAQNQQKFWQYHNLAFEQQKQLNEDSVASIAKTVGLDMTLFSDCLAAPETARKVRAAEKQAIALGARGTPAIYINGKKFSGNLKEDLVRALEPFLR